MAHRALTLKYRPQVFADMVGQDHVSSVLGRALESGRIAHAFLFTGARGVGKTTSARILAKALNCERRASGELEGPDPCNNCTSCLEITNGISLDVSEIDGASNRGIADVQALREKVRFSPTGGRYRVVIIDEVHQLSNDAFAALLKTLEEPPPHLVFIFATTDPQKLPDTIRSRTQRFDFARVPIRKVADRLLDVARREAADPEGVKFELTEGAALLIAQKSEGALRDAVSALDQVISSGEQKVDDELVRRVLGIPDREAFFRLAESIVRRDPREALRALHEAFAKGLDPRDLAEGLSEHVRHILVLKVDPKGEDLVPATREELDRLRTQGADWSENDLLRLLRLASEALVPMKESPQPLVHLEAAVLQMATLEPGETLAELLGRLEALERRLGGAAQEAPDDRGGGTAPPSRGTKPTGVVRESPARGAMSQATVKSAPRAWAEGPATAVAEPPPATGPRDAAPRANAPSVTRPTDAPPVPRPADAAPVARVVLSAPAADALSDGAAAPLLDETNQRCWSDVIAAVNARKRMLGAFLEESRFVGVQGTSLVLVTDDLHRAVVEENENRKLVTEEARRVFGQPLQILCAKTVPAGAAAVTPAPEPVDVQAMIERTIAWFDGEAITPAAPRPMSSDRRQWQRPGERNG